MKDDLKNEFEMLSNNVLHCMDAITGSDGEHVTLHQDNNKQCNGGADILLCFGKEGVTITEALRHIEKQIKHVARVHKNMESDQRSQKSMDKIVARFGVMLINEIDYYKRELEGV